jgi:hypothetical protein
MVSEMKFGMGAPGAGRLQRQQSGFLVNLD